MNASFTASLLTMVCYSCPEVYNKRYSGLLKLFPLWARGTYVCVMSECVTVCVFAICKLYQYPRLVHLSHHLGLDIICLVHSHRCLHALRNSILNGRTKGPLTSFFWSFQCMSCFWVDTTIYNNVIFVFVELKQ